MSSSLQAYRERGRDARNGARQAVGDVSPAVVQSPRGVAGSEIDRAAQPS
jgi:hypothetical protein